MALAIDLERGQTPDEHAAAFTALYREFSGPLLAYCRRLTGPDGDPEGLAHEAFLRAWASWDASCARPFWPWLVTVVRRLAIDHFRKVARRRTRTYVELELSTGSRFPQPEEHAERAAEHATVRQALADLPAVYQRMVRMRHVEGLSYDEIAAAEGTSTEAVRGMLRRARQALRAAYTRIEVGVPAVFGLAGLRRFRGRFMDWAMRLQLRLRPGPELAATEAFKGTVVLFVALATGAPLAGPAEPAPATVHGAASGATAHAAAPARDHRGGGTAPGSMAGGAAAADPDGGVPPVPESPVPGLALPGQEITTPEQATFNDLTPSPRPGDRTVFAAGDGYAGCDGVSCPMLFRSADGGHTWQRLPALGYLGGRVLLPPAWPRDPRIFVVGPRGLALSSDGGATFHGITPAGRSGAMSPAFSAGDPHIWLGFLTGWDYDDRDGLLRPVNLNPLPSGDHNTFAFSPAWPGDARVAVGSWVPSPETVQQGAVTICRDGHCPPATRLFGITATPELLVPDAFTRAGVAFAWGGKHLYRTRDAGGSYYAVALPDDAKITGLVAGSDDRLYLTMADFTEDGLTGGLFVSDNWGDTWRRIGRGTALDGGVVSATPFAGGRLLAAPQALANGGLLCSENNGRTWATRCS